MTVSEARLDYLMLWVANEIVVWKVKGLVKKIYEAGLTSQDGEVALTSEMEVRSRRLRRSRSRVTLEEWLDELLAVLDCKRVTKISENVSFF